MTQTTITKHYTLQPYKDYTLVLLFAPHMPNNTHTGASMIKWTTLDPCSSLSESDPKLYTNFEVYKIEIHKHLESIWIYKAKQYLFTKKIKQHICIIEDGASDKKVGDTEKIIVKNLFEM